MMHSLEERAKMASKIQAKPHNFKVCECCGSIVMKKAPVCPNCNGYRFNTEKNRVREQAAELAKREPMSIDMADYQ